MRKDTPWCAGTKMKPTQMLRQGRTSWPWMKGVGRCPECGRAMSVSNATGLMLPHGWSPKYRSRRQVMVEDL